jgi:predicted transposase YdaD
MDFGYRVVRLWEDDAEKLLAGDLGLTPLAKLGRLPKSISLEDGLGTIARRLVERLVKEASSDRAGRLWTTALLLTGLRVRRNAAIRIFRGVRMMEESDTYLMILEEGEAKGMREMVLFLGERRLGSPDESVMASINNVSDMSRLKRMAAGADTAVSWRDIVETP